MNSLFSSQSKTRDTDDLLACSLAVIDRAFDVGANTMLPLFSGGHDSLCACFVASQHPRFAGSVYHIDTGIGANATREFVEETCREFKWTLRVYKSPFTYEMFIRKYGFPGPGGHQWVYARLKERCIRLMTKGTEPRLLITGCRQQESKRRMGHTAPIKIGETSKKTAKVTNKKRIWTAPCHDWSGEEQRSFLNDWALPRNPVKESLLGMSGECFCGAFARPYELEMIQQFAPDVATEIARLEQIAKECGRVQCQWGKRQPGENGQVTVRTGPLCSSCDRKAAAAGVLFDDLE